MKDFLTELLALQTRAKLSKIEAQAELDATLRQRIEKLKAEALPIIAKIEEICKKAAASDQDHANIMTLVQGYEEGISDFTKSPRGYDDVPYANLGVVAREVWAHCVNELGMTPQAIQIGDGAGIKSDYYLRLSWKAKAAPRPNLRQTGAII